MMKTRSNAQRDALAIGMLGALKKKSVKPGDRFLVVFESKLKKPYTNNGLRQTHDDGECFLEIYLSKAHLTAFQKAKP